MQFHNLHFLFFPEMSPLVTKCRWKLSIRQLYRLKRCTMLKHPVHSLAPPPFTLHGHTSRKFDAVYVI